MELRSSRLDTMNSSSTDLYPSRQGALNMVDLSARDDRANACAKEGRTTTRSTTAVDAHVGMMVKLRRVELDISQDKLATALGITSQQLKKYERGANRIGASRLYDISELLDVPIQYFFRDYGNNRQNDDDDGPANPLADALGDAATFRLLRMFSEMRDQTLKRRVIGLVEAVLASD